MCFQGFSGLDGLLGVEGNEGYPVGNIMIKYTMCSIVSGIFLGFNILVSILLHQRVESGSLELLDHMD